ncbi:MAG: potassium channel protein [Bryobacteraceae bacterium]
MEHIQRRLARIAIAVLITMTVGTVGFVLVEGWDWFDAFYMTLSTITTVGYFEIHSLTRAGRIFNCFVIFFGVTTLFLAVGAVTQTVIELELSQYFSKRRTNNMIAKLKEHIIICGFGRVGRGAAHELQQAGVPFVIVDNDEDRVESAMKAGMLAVVADATRDETLRDVGIAHAKGLIATLRSDADNLFVILSAKNLNPAAQLTARVAEEEAERKMRRAGADYTFAPYTMTGHRMAQALIRPHVHQFLDYTQSIGLDVNIEQVRVAETSEFARQSLAEMRVRKDLGIIVLAIRKSDGTMIFNPPAEANVQGGDFLIAMGDSTNLRKLEELLTGAPA